MVTLLECRTAHSMPQKAFSWFPERYVKKELKKIRNKYFMQAAVYLPESNNAVLKEKRMRRAAYMLRGEGIKTAVAESSFPYVRLFRNAGIEVLSPAYAYSRFALEIAEAALKKARFPFGGTTGVIYADRLTKDVSDFAFKLMRLTEFLRLDGAFQKRRLKDRLFLEYGVCPLEKPAFSREVLICFSAPSEEYLKNCMAELIVNLSGVKFEKDGAFGFSDAVFSVPHDIASVMTPDPKAVSLLLLSGIANFTEVKVEDVV